MTDDADENPPSWSAAWPFLVAVVIVVVGIAIVVLLNVLHPASKRLSDSALVSRAINDQYTSRNSLDYAKYRDVTCASDINAAGFPDERTFSADNGKLRDAKGQLVINDIADTTVDGDTATANVHWHYADTSSDVTTTATTLVKEGDDWKLCSHGR